MQFPIGHAASSTRTWLHASEVLGDDGRSFSPNGETALAKRQTGLRSQI